MKFVLLLSALAGILVKEGNCYTCFSNDQCSYGGNTWEAPWLSACCQSGAGSALYEVNSHCIQCGGGGVGV